MRAVADADDTTFARVVLASDVPVVIDVDAGTRVAIVNPRAVMNEPVLHDLAEEPAGRLRAVIDTVAP